MKTKKRYGYGKSVKRNPGNGVLESKTRKRVKGWGIYSERRNEFADKFFDTREGAKTELREASYHSNPLVMKEVMKSYKIIPVEIYYELPPNKGKR